MIRQRIHLSSLMFVIVAFGLTVGESAATEYVWARSGYGALPIGHNATSFSNGYGGYYVPKNAYGNNHESQRPFKNPNGFIVPATPVKCPAPQLTPSVANATQPTSAAQPSPSPISSSHPQMRPILTKPTFQQKMSRFWSH